MLLPVIGQSNKKLGGRNDSGHNQKQYLINLAGIHLQHQIQRKCRNQNRNTKHSPYYLFFPEFQHPLPRQSVSFHIGMSHHPRGRPTVQKLGEDDEEGGYGEEEGHVMDLIWCRKIGIHQGINLTCLNSPSAEAFPNWHFII